MINLGKLVLFIAIMAMFVNNVKAYDNEVWATGNTYYWKINGVEAGSSANLSTAISSCIGNNREVHILTSGTLTSTLTIRSTNVKLFCHDNTLTCNFTGSGIINNGNDGLEIHDLTLRNVVGGYGIRSSAASNLRFTNLTLIDIGWLGMRIDSRTSNPWDHTIYNVYMKDCHFENTGGHGLEFYSIDGLTLEGTMTARHTGDCGVLLNNCNDATIETVDAYDCNWGGGYAGLRYANGCSNVTTNQLYADRCGRGFFIVKSGPSVNCHVNNAQIGECSGLGIWIENGTNCSVKAGCSNSPVSVSGSGSYANVSQNCDVAPDCNGTPGGSAYLDNCNRCVEGNTGIVPCATSLNEGIYRIHPVHSNLCLADNNPSTQENCADVAAQYWEVTRDGDNYQIRSLGNDQYLSVGSGVQGENTGMSSSAVALSLGDAGNGNYYIQSANNPALVFDVLNISTAVGEPIILWENTGADNQRFRFESVSVVMDCNRDINGSATLDDCGICSGGNTGLDACVGAMQGEDFCEALGVFEDSNDGFMGTGYINFDNQVGSNGKWFIHSETSGSKTIGIRYANGGTGARGMSITVNGSQQVNFQANPTASWTDWESETITLNLNAGVNEIVLTATTAEGGPNVDLFSFVSEGLKSGGCDADCNGVIGGLAYLDNCNTCVEGNTGLEACEQDCQGTWGGTTLQDECGVCLTDASILPCTGSLEAETACTVDGIQLEAENLGFSGQGYVNTTNAVGAYATWGVNSTEAQTATR